MISLKILKKKCQINYTWENLFSRLSLLKEHAMIKKLFLSLASVWVNNNPNSLLSFLAKLFFKNKLLYSRINLDLEKGCKDSTEF